MTEKDITLGESDGGGGGVSSISMCGGNLEANGGKIKSQRVHVKTNVSSKEADEEGFLSTSPDSANGDQMVLVGGHQINTNADHQQPTTKTTTTLAPTNGNSGELNADTHKATVPVLYTACPATHCVTLKNILDSFKAPLSEEQAWALIYQFVSLYRKVSDARARYVFTAREVPKTMENLNLHRDGSVHFSCYKKLNERRVTSRQAAEGKALDDAEAAHLEQRQRNQHTTSNAVIGRAFDKHASTPTPLPAVSHRKIIRELAILVYTALDYNLQADEQYQMSQELEELITYMTADESDDDCIDEGIDEGDKRWDDENDDEKCNETKELDFILEACRNHVKPTVPEDHYKAVCRALVTETLELRIFLQQVLNDGAEKLHLAADSQTSQKELAKLGFNDWARFWVQVIDELRRGVRLKKSNFERAPIEYELTPYEILMEDIRSKKYQLRKVMVNGDIPPRVKKDAHALILEFIRSRPPLKKASERKLPPPLKRTPSPREQLMDSIRQGRTLKHITPPALPRLKDRLLPPTNQMTSSASAALPTTTGTGGVTELPRSNQRLIKVDFSLLQDDDTFFDGSRTSHVCVAHIGVCSQPKMPPYPIGGYMVKENAATGQAPLLRNTRRTKEPFTKDEYHRFFDNALESYDLATQCESRRASLRRHTIVGCQSNFDETHSMPPSRPDSRQSQASDVNATATATGSAASTTKEQHNNYNQEQQQRLKRTKSPAPSCGGNSTGGIAAGAEETHCSSRSASSLGPWNKSFLDKKTWMERGDDRLSLTLEEIVHIRSVMTKAELEGLPVGVRVKEDVEKRKVCFLCLRTRFSIFGPWGIQCKLCQRTVCSKCYTKMRIPAEHSRNVPLVLISPSLLSSPASSSTPSPSHQAQYSYSSSTGNMDDAFPKTLIERLLRSESERKTRNSVGSAPSSPKHQRSNMSTPGLQATTSKEAAVNAAAAAGQAVEALHDDAMSSSYTAAVKPSPQLAAAKQNYNVMSRSMEGPRSLPVHSPARPLSSSSTLDRKSRFSRGFTLSASGSQLTQDQKENMRGEQVPVCNDCQGLVNEITSSAKQKRSSARNRTLQKLTLDLSPVWK